MTESYAVHGSNKKGQYISLDKIYQNRLVLLIKF